MAEVHNINHYMKLSNLIPQGLAFALQELSNNGQIISIEGVTLMPRIILMTDGEPDDKPKTLALANAIGM